MTPEQMALLKNAVQALDDEYWCGSNTSVSLALNAVEDALTEIRAAWPRKD
jgi:hypothetical protein